MVLKLQWVVIETSASRHHRGPISIPLKPLEHHSTMVTRVLRTTLNWTPTVPRGTSLSDSSIPGVRKRSIEKQTENSIQIERKLFVIKKNVKNKKPKLRSFPKNKNIETIIVR